MEGEYKSIVFSGVPGSGKSTVVKIVAEKTGMPQLSLGDMWRKRWESSGSDKSFEAYWRDISREDNSAMTEKACQRVLDQAMIGDFRYVYPIHKQRVRKSSVEAGSIVLVFITADIDTRVSRAWNTEKYNNVRSVRELKKVLNNREQDEVRAGRLLFGPEYDYRDEKYYDLIFNSRDTCPQRIAQAVMRAIAKHPWDYL